MTDEKEKQYRLLKRERILEQVVPMAKAFGIEEIDYWPEEGEYLVLDGQKIACGCNSDYAVINELLQYLFVKRKMYQYYPNGEKLKKKMMAYWRD